MPHKRWEIKLPEHLEPIHQNSTCTPDINFILFDIADDKSLKQSWPRQHIKKIFKALFVFANVNQSEQSIVASKFYKYVDKAFSLKQIPTSVFAHE